MSRPAEAATADGGTDERTLTVLIAEDDPAMRAALAELLRFTSGLEVVAIVGDVPGAVEAAVALHPDAAVVDVRMPGGGGPRAARLIRERAPATRIVAFSAYADRGAVLEMLRAGAVEYAIKGGDADALIDAIRRVGPGRVDLPPGEMDGLIGDLAALLVRYEAETDSLGGRLSEAAAGAERAARAFRSGEDPAAAAGLADLDEALSIIRAVARDLSGISGQSSLEQRTQLVADEVA